MIAEQLGGVQLSLQLCREDQYIPTVGILAERLALQLPNQFDLRETCALQDTLDLIKAGSKRGEEREGEERGESRLAEAQEKG